MTLAHRFAFAALAFFAQVACGPTPPAFPDREPGVRAPLSAQCDATDATRCALPWPSNTFAVADETTPTGLKLALDFKTLPSLDEVTYLNHADGFSRLSPLLAGFPGRLSPDSLGAGEGTALRLLVAQPGAPDEATFIPLRMSRVESSSKVKGEETLLIGYPLRPMAAATDHLVMVMDSLKAADGSSFEADRLTRLALGLEEATNDDERIRVAYHAPTRALLERAQVDPARVLRVWDFTTRSLHDPRRRLQSMRAQTIAAVDEGRVDIALDSVTVSASAGAVLAVVEGRLTGMPTFRNEEGKLTFDAQGAPIPAGVHDAPFRVMIPKGAGDYRMVMFGHGTGGKVNDDTFDESIASEGLGKAGGLYYGWDETGIFGTVLALQAVNSGVARSSAGLMQALADISALEQALNGKLGDLLAAPTLHGAPNPAAGRRPDAKEPVWTGGSLGGTLGFVYSGLSPRVRFAVLNVPGAGWTHFIPGSTIFDLVGASLADKYPSALDFTLNLMVSQLLWDDIDGGNWADELAAEGAVYLVQESMGDPVLPNPGSELVASAVKAVHLGQVLAPVPGLSFALEVEGQSAFTQFRVPDGTEGLDRHGFANRGTLAGEAAREQIRGFLSSALTGTPRIELPSQCRTNTVPNSCDFSL